MSNIYIQEPPTDGKICLETTAGDIDIELWSREAPKACRNFVQLCMEGYYDGTIFHRLVKGFIVQGGDPTGTGTGGNSIWGKPFKDEFHSRLRFVRRGLVAMANAGKDDNGSQFFFTLGATPELQNKHTIFGKIGGNTIYNMLKLEEGLTDEDERPLYPHKIVKTRILSNPFNDIVPRETIKRAKDSKKDKSKSTAAATKNYKLLSFGEEAEEDEEEVEEVNKKFSGKSKSSHDLIKDPKLSSEPAVEPSDTSSAKRKKQHSDSESRSESDEEDVDPNERSAKVKADEDDEERRKTDEKHIQSVRDKLKSRSSKDASKAESKHKSSDKKKSGDEEDDEDYYLGKDEKIAQKKKVEQLRKEYKELRKSMKKEKEEKDEELQKATKEAEEKAAKLAADNNVIKAYMDEQKKYKEVKAKVPKKGEDREALTLALLAKFKSKIETAKETCPEETVARSSKGNKDKESGEMIDEEEEDDDNDDPTDISWLAKKLHYDNKSEVLAKDANKKGDDWFDIYDPRNALSKRRREQSKQDSKEKKRARINN